MMFILYIRSWINNIHYTYKIYYYVIRILNYNTPRSIPAYFEQILLLFYGQRSWHTVLYIHYVDGRPIYNLYNTFTRLVNVNTIKEKDLNIRLLILYNHINITFNYYFKFKLTNTGFCYNIHQHISSFIIKCIV